MTMQITFCINCGRKIERVKTRGKQPKYCRDCGEELNRERARRRYELIRRCKDKNNIPAKKSPLYRRGWLAEVFGVSFDL